jgi:hypothetical protein
VELTVPEREDERSRTIKLRNRVLFAVLLALALLFYAIAIVRMGS